MASPKRKPPKQTPLHRDVEFVLDAQFTDKAWGKRFLRRLVREAIERSGLGWPSQRDAVMDRVAKELIP